MMTLEVVALGIVVLFVLVRAKYGPEPKRFLTQMALLVLTSWVVEDSVISAYGFYYYSPRWSLFVHHVPLAILLIWPVVIHSAWELAANLLGDSRRWVPLVGALLVWADASLIEPIAVSAGLWTWTEPGLFSVPPIGVLGWAFYAGLCMVVFERRQATAINVLRDGLALLLAPLGTHLLLLGAWWGLFRWINRSWAPEPFVVLAWLLSIALAVWSLKSEARRRVPVVAMWSRVPAALFFFVLLAQHSAHKLALVVYALAFAPPYISLTRFTSGPGPEVVEES